MIRRVLGLSLLGLLVCIGSGALASAFPQPGLAMHLTDARTRYDLRGPVKRLTMGNLVVEFDTHGNEVRALTSHPNGHMLTTRESVNTYDENGRLVKQVMVETDVRGRQNPPRVLTFTYDPQGRLAQEVTDGSIRRYTYDPLGRLVQRQDEYHLLTYTYTASGAPHQAEIDEMGGPNRRALLDAWGRCMELWRFGDRGLLEEKVYYRYDAWGNQTVTSTYRKGKLQSRLADRYTYDTFGNWTTCTEWNEPRGKGDICFPAKTTMRKIEYYQGGG
ncbi:MAG: hypothetical protein ACYDBB_22975 [Armatimonadota bacterium]